MFGTLSEIGQLNGTLSQTIVHQHYQGKYEVVPKVSEDQTLKTKDRILVNDILVKKIPYHETSNPSNGNTVYIGEME